MVAVRDSKRGFDHAYSSISTFITEAVVEELKINAITTNMVSPQQIGNMIRWTADVDGNGLKYQWNIYKDGKLFKSLDYSRDNFVEYTPTEEGVYKVMVAIRDIYGDFDHKYSSDFISITESEVKELKINSIEANLLSPQPSGETIRWTVGVVGNGIKYEWCIYKDGARIQDYPFNTQNYLDWTPSMEGFYKVMVGVKDIFGNYQYRFSENININSN